MVHIEALAAAALTKQPEADETQPMGGPARRDAAFSAGRRRADRQARIGSPGRVPRVPRQRPGRQPATREVWRHVQHNLVAFFGEGRDPSTITAGDADDFKQRLIA